MIGRAIILFCLIASISSLNFNLLKSQVQSNSQWTRVKIHVENGIEPLTFSYTFLPVGWKQVRNYVYIPKTVFFNDMKYPCRLIVRDQNFNELRGTIIFVTTQNTLFISQNIYSYDHEFELTFFFEGGFNGQPQMTEHKDYNIQQKKAEMKQKMVQIEERPRAQTRSAEQSTNLVTTVGSGLNNIVNTLIPEEQTNLAKTVSQQIKKVQERAKVQTQQRSQKRSIESIFVRFPSPAELDQIIIKGDAFTISKTIQTVISTETLNCEQKIAYLADFFGRIKSAIEMKKFTASQIKIIIDSAEAQIQRLLNEIKFNEQSLQKLGIQELQRKLAVNLKILEEQYDKFNENDIKIKPQEDQLVIVQGKQGALKNENDKNRQNLVQRKLDLVEAETAIERLEQELQKAKRRKGSIANDISDLQRQIGRIQFQLLTLERNRQTIEFRIRQINEKSDELRKEYTEQQIIVERLRGDSNRGRQRENAFVQIINELQDRALIQKQKLAYRQLQILNNLIQVLERNLPNIQEDIDRIYYSCFSLIEIESEVDQGILIYIIDGKKFESYLKNAYGNAPTTSITSSVSLTTSNILNQVWSASFGAAFNETSKANSNSFSFSSDFNCLNPSTLQSGFGTIKSIQNNIIMVETKEGQFSLKLGACSRIQSVTPLPSVGKTIYWRANYIGNNVYQVYTASCI